MSKEWIKQIAMAAIVFLVFFPFWILILNSAKTPYQFFHTDPWILAHPTHWLDNYRFAWTRIRGSLVNSILYASVVSGCVVMLSAFSAFVFARFEFRGKQLIYFLILSLMLVPGFLTLIPAFMLNKHLGLLDTRWVLVLPYLALGQVLGIFLLRVFFEAQPAALFEAAKLDGASDLQCFWYVALPLCRPTLATLAILNTITIWNDLVWPYMTVGDSAKWPVALAIFNMFQDGTVSWGALFAAYCLASLPLIILFFAASSAFIRGLSAGAVKS